MKAVITVDDTRVYETLVPEQTKTKRASIVVTKNKTQTIVTITADDATALRAMFTGISRQITVFEKMRDKDL